MFQKDFRKSYILKKHIEIWSIFKSLVSSSSVAKVWAVFSLIFLFGYTFSIIVFYELFPDLSLWKLLFSAYLIFVCAGYFYYGLNKVKLTDQTGKPMMPAWIFAVVITIFYWYISAMYGAESCPDSQSQWQQVLSGRINDWHPIIHTLLLGAFVKIFKSMYAAVLAFQLIFAISCAWLYSTLKRYRYKNYIIWLIVGFIVFSQTSLAYQRILIKDASFATITLACCTAVIHIWHTKGQWLQNNCNKIIFALLIFLSSFLRHNGIFYTIPLLLFLPLLSAKSNKKASLVCVGLSIVLLFGYISARKIMIKEKIIDLRFKNSGTQSFVETVGIPMTMMLEVFVNEPQKCPPEVHEFFNKFAPREFWGKYYEGNFNSVKFKIKNLTSDFLLHTDKKRFLSMWLETVKNAPGFCLKSFIFVTHVGLRPSITPDSSYSLLYHYYMMEYDGRDKFISWMCQSYKSMIFSCLSAPGMMMLLLVIFGVFGFLRHGWKILPVFAPLFAYGFGTTLLLCGWDFRFFYVLFIGVPPMLLLCCDKRDDADSGC